MAEFALGLTKMAVEGTVSRVNLAIEEEKKLRVRVQNDLMFITGEFQMMQSFLKVANVKDAQNEVARTWVRQVRDLAFQVEDCVEFVVHLEKETPWGWLQRLGRTLVSCNAPPLPLDMAVDDIKNIKARVEDVSQRNTRYNLIIDSGSNSKAASLDEQPSRANTGPSAFRMLRKVWEDTGKWRGMGDLAELIKSGGRDREVISVWGSTGPADLGVTPVLIKAYSDPEICHGFETRAWVKLMTPFNPDEFLKSLLTQVCASSSEASIDAEFRASMNAAVNTGDDRQKTKLMRQLMSGMKYFVILEEVSTVVEWDVIKSYLPDSKNNSRLVVSTKQLQIALLCTGEPYKVSELSRFSGDQSLCAFSKKDCASRLLSNRSEEARVWTNTFELVGRQEESAWDLGRMMWRYDGAISVWGIAGVGKSTLVRSVYCHAMIGLQQSIRQARGRLVCDYALLGFTMYSWVDVPHPFNLTDFSRCLLLDFHSDDMQAKEGAAVGFVEGQDPIQGCRRILHQHKCFVVIDGLLSTDDWDLIKGAFLPDSTKSCIIVITNEKKVATHCVEKEDHVVNVKGLESGLHLFKKISWDGKGLTHDETELSEHIVAKCGGILKVIASIGEVFAKEIAPFRGVSTTDTDTERRKWEATALVNHINGDFMGTLEKDPKFHSLRGLFAWMQSYFDACSDSLKPCIFYMSVFPAKHNIRRRRLVRRWMAEGYSRDASNKTAEENGESLFSELVDLSIIQHLETNVMCQVNAFFHEYIISRPMEDNLVFALDGHCSFNSQYAGQHLTIRSGWDRDEVVFKGIDVSRLRSLTVFDKWKSFLVSENMRLVRVLDLEDARNVTNDDLEQIVELLPRLKFLSLRGHKKISHLPESLCGLIQLQTLDVRGTSIVTLPRGITKLQKLSYIRAGTKKTSEEGDDIVASLPTTDVDQTSTPPADIDDAARVQEAVVGDDVQTSTTPWRRSRTFVPSWLSKFRKLRYDNGGVKVPAGIGNMTALHTLGVVNVNVSGGKAIVKDLKKLTQLRKLGVSGINRENWVEFCLVISGHGHLESLSVQVEEDKDGLFACFRDISEPPRTLKSLKAYGHVQISPVWLKPLQNIRKVNFGLTILTQQDLEIGPWGQFTYVHGKGREIMYRVLEIDCTSSLELTFHWNPLVTVLKVKCSSESSLRVSGLERLEKLEEVWLKGSYSNELKQDLQRQILEHPKKPELKLEESRPS